MSVRTFGLIVPHPPIFMASIGGDRRFEARASLDALQQAWLALEAYDPETIVLMSPHAPAVYDTFLVETAPVVTGSLSEFGAPETYSWNVDTQLADAIISAVDMSDIPVAPRDVDQRLRSGWLDHASIVPLSFLDPRSSRRVVVLSLSFLALSSHRILGELVRQTAEDMDRRVAFVASGDCSHRLTPDAPAGYSVRGQEFDERLAGIVRTGMLSELANIDSEIVQEAGECGLRSFVALGGFSGEDPVATRVLAYEGPLGVGYLTALVGAEAVDRNSGSRIVVVDADTTGDGAAPSAESEIVALARDTIAARLGQGDAPKVVLTSSEYPVQAGAFVSLHRDGALRGCIGTIASTKATLAEEVASNAIEAAMHDPRFESLSAAELADLDISVDVLYPPEPALLDGLDQSKYGVIVTSGHRRGLLLPDLPGVDDVATQLEIALSKGGISPSDDFEIERFRVERYH